MSVAETASRGGLAAMPPFEAISQVLASALESGFALHHFRTSQCHPGITVWLRFQGKACCFPQTAS